MNKEDIARVCHEVNRAYCEALGDTSQARWEDAPDWQKESALKGVDLHLQNPHAGPETSHESWMKEKLDAGWVYGEIKDPETKTHPCLVPFAELPREQQAKDYLFRGVVHTLVPYLSDIAANHSSAAPEFSRQNDVLGMSPESRKNLWQTIGTDAWNAQVGLPIPPEWLAPFDTPATD